MTRPTPVERHALPFFPNFPTALRTAIEKHFPNARPFQRPGFDTLKFPKK